eukprot:3209602-Heterocapsa_arctica.AAC.1
MSAKLRMSPSVLAASWDSSSAHSSTGMWAISISPCMPPIPMGYTHAVHAARTLSSPKRNFSSMSLLTAFRPFLEVPLHPFKPLRSGDGMSAARVDDHLDCLGPQDVA